MVSNKELKQLGTHIREIRKTKNIELKQVAAEMGITPQAYGNIENGKTDISISQAQKLSEIFKESVSKILNIESNTIYNFAPSNNSGGTFLQHANNYYTISDEILNKFAEMVVLIRK